MKYYTMVYRTSTMKVEYGFMLPREYKEGSIITSHDRLTKNTCTEVIDSWEIEKISNFKLAKYDIYEIKILGDKLYDGNRIRTNKFEVIKKLTEDDRNKLFKDNDDKARDCMKDRVKLWFEAIGVGTVYGFTFYVLGVVINKLIKKVTAQYQ